MTALTVARPGGGLYRPHKVIAQLLGDEETIESVVVLGTHDQHFARPIAQAALEERARAYGTSRYWTHTIALASGPGELVWYRRQLVGFYEDAAYYSFIDDEVNGRAGVLFQVDDTFDWDLPEPRASAPAS